MDPFGTLRVVPCPGCGEPLPQGVAGCPRCGGPPRCDVVLHAPLAPREAYGAARELSELPDGPPLLPTKLALEAGGRVLADVALLRGAQAIDILAAHGGDAELAPVTAPPVRGGIGLRGRPLPLALAAVAVLALLAWWALARSGDGDAAPVDGAPGAGVAPAPGIAAAAPLPAREIGRLAARSTASVRCADSQGSGFFVSGERLVTNAHVLCGEREPVRVVLADGRELAAVPLRMDDDRDLALLRVDGAAVPPLPLGDASSLRQGDTVFFYGNPRGLDFTLGQALVSHAGRLVHGLVYVQVDGSINPGNSGGPLLDDRGNVVGVVTMEVAAASGLGLALPVNYLYDGEPSLVPPPPEADLAAWRELLRRAAAEDAKAADEARVEMARPGLVGAFLDERGGVIAVVARQSELPPFVERLDFRLEQGGATLCSPSGVPSLWQRAGDAEGAVDEPTRRWLRRHRLDAAVWAARVELDWGRCPPAGETLGHLLVLEGALRGAESAPVTMAPTQR
jgi:serine protease Do